MRTLIEVLIIGALIALTWQQSLQDRFNALTGAKVQATPMPEPPAPIVRYVPQPTPTASGQWMWDPARRSTLDRPAYDSRDKSQKYLDAEGRRFWIDGNGVRHYDP